MEASVDAARRVRDDAAALCAESRQAQRHAAEIRRETNAILDTVALLLTNLLRREGFALLAPIAVRFRTAEGGSTGVQVVVRLSDANQREAVKAAIGARFPDRLSEVVVS